jgi:DNA-binding LacI/PurR family transcriptional regulator
MEQVRRTAQSVAQAGAAKRVTIFDVAARAGVAISSASAALNGRPGVSEATRQRVRAAADELGFVPSLRGRSLSTRRAFAIGLVVQREPDVLESDPFFGGFIGGIEVAIAGRGYALVLQIGFDEAHADSRYRELAANRRVDGVIVNEVRIDDPRIDLVRELGLPAVGIVPDLPDFPLPHVRQSAVGVVTELVGHLTGLGHTRIAHVAGPPGYVHSRERAEAWRHALEAAGLEPGPLLTADFTYASGRRAADELLGLDEPPTAAVCVNDLSAVGFMVRAQELGVRIPEDMSITGYDGIELGTYIRPTLTTVQTSPRRMGFAAATLLLDLIESKTGTVDDVDVPAGTLVVRQSTGPAPDRPPVPAAR